MCICMCARGVDAQDKEVSSVFFPLCSENIRGSGVVHSTVGSCGEKSALGLGLDLGLK